MLAVDPVDGGFTELQCFSATARAGCTTLPALAGASDVAAPISYGDVYVAARDSDAVLRFERNGDALEYAGCAAAARPECFAAPELDGPTALAVPVLGPLWVVSSDAVHWFGTPQLGDHRCFRQGDGGDCTGGRALDGPSDVAVVGDLALVASSGSDGVAVFQDGAQRAGAAGCITSGGGEGCTQGAGLDGAARVAVHGGTAYVAAPGSGAVTTLRVPFEAGAPSRLASDAAPTGALAIPPDHHLADAPSYAGSHVYTGGAGIAPFARDFSTGRLTPLARPAFSPAGGVAGLTVSGDTESTAVYAAVPSAGAVVAFARNIPPSCSRGFAPPEPDVKVGPFAAEVPTHCRDANHDALTYSVATPPALGSVLGFRGDFAVYQGPGTNVPPRTDSFTVRASDGAESATAFIRLQLDYLAEDRFPPRAPEIRVLDGRARLDRRGRIALRLRCRTDGLPCAAGLALRRGRRVGRATATLAAGATRRVRVKLGKRVRRSIRRHRRKGLLLTAVATARLGDGRTDRATRRVRVRPRRAP